MAVASQPTATSIVTEGLKRGGRTSPTAAQIASALSEALQEVKSDIMSYAPTHPNLMTTATTVTTRGQQRYAIPSDSDEQATISLLDGPDDWRGTVVSATASTIVLASSLSVSADDIVGKYILITGDPGIEQFREILTYNPSIQTATIDINWVSIPTSVSTYLIVNSYYKLWDTDTVTELDNVYNPTVLGTPRNAATFANEFLLYPVPDKSTYGLMNRYWVDLSLVDESGDVFLQLLREWRSLFIQGIAVKTMQRYDEDRYQLELGVYNSMLQALSVDTCQVTQVRYKD